MARSRHSQVRRHALVTGAGSGIGLACARRLAQEGFLVFAHFNSAYPELKALKKTPEVLCIKADLANQKQVKKLAAFCLENGGVDVLVNCAAALASTKGGDFEALTEAELDHAMAVNLKAPIFLAQAFLPKMKRQAWGRIINLSSIGLKFGGSVVTPHYTLSKAALEGLTKVLNRNYAASNILVNTIQVGVTKTKMHSHRSAEEIKKRIAQIPLRRMAEPEEIADVVVFLATKGSFVANSQIAVAGGE